VSFCLFGLYAFVSTDVLSFLRMFFIRSLGVLAFINAAKQVWAVSGNASEDANTQTVVDENIHHN